MTIITFCTRIDFYWYWSTFHVQVIHEVRVCAESKILKPVMSNTRHACATVWPAEPKPLVGALSLLIETPLLLDWWLIPDWLDQLSLTLFVREHVGSLGSYAVLLIADLMLITSHVFQDTVSSKIVIVPGGKRSNLLNENKIDYQFVSNLAKSHKTISTFWSHNLSLMHYGIIETYIDSNNRHRGYWLSFLLGTGLPKSRKYW